MRISELPEGERELALLRQIECQITSNKTTDNLSLAFDWYSTVEGDEYWSDLNYKEGTIEPKNYDDVIAIIETKIATMSSRGFESYYLPIGILKDLIREIKEIK
jgi:hypothetical protein